MVNSEQNGRRRDRNQKIIVLLRGGLKSFSMRSWFLVFFICAVLCSCASVKVKKCEVLTARAPTNPPERILVKPATFYGPGLRVDRSGADLEHFKYELQEKFTRNLARQLSSTIAPTYALAATAPISRGKYWLMIVRFDAVDQGSRLLRSVVGFGAGATKLQMSVVVYDLSSRKPRPFLLVETTGGSNWMPGAPGTAAYLVTGVTALVSSRNPFEGTRSGLTFDIIRTTREVTACLSDFLARRGH
jgi:hypothetical protein